MKLGIDIDDVVVDTSSHVSKYFLPLFRNNPDIMNNIKDIVRGKVTNPTVQQAVKKHAAKVWRKAKVKPDAVRVLNNLKANGFELIYITARNNDLNSEAEVVTYEYFKNHNIPYDKIIFGTYDKVESCIEAGIDIFIDDSVDTCNNLLKQTDIKVYLFNSNINQNLECFAPRVNNWLELEQKIMECKLK